MDMTELDDLHKQNWHRIPHTAYIMKYIFTNTGYNMIITNLIFMYSEKLADTNILERFQKLNPFAQMKLQVILENLRKTLQKCFTESTELNLRLNSEKLVIALQFPVAHVLCNYDIEMTVMGAEKITQFIIGPTVSSALLTQRKVLELENKIKSIKSGTKCILSVLTWNGKNIREFANHSLVVTLSKQDSLNAIDPGLLNGENVPIETITDSFLKVQSNLKDLLSENQEAYNELRKEKLKKESPFQSTSPNKKHKHRENCDNESIKFDDGEEIPDKEKTVQTDATHLQPVKKETKKMKHKFKI